MLDPYTTPFEEWPDDWYERTPENIEAIKRFLDRLGMKASDLTADGSCFCEINESVYDEALAAGDYGFLFAAASDNGDIAWVCRHVLGMTDADE